MNTLELMDASVSSFSKTDHAIYETIRKFPDNFATQSVTQISQVTGYSKPALTRFAKRLGFSGFVEFQYQFAQDLEQQRSRVDGPTHAEEYGNLLRAVEERVDAERLKALAERMGQSHCTYVMGYNLSRFPAEELSIAVQLETDLHVVSTPVDIMPGFECNDTLVLFSAVNGSSHRELMDAMKMGRSQRPYMVLVTTNAKHPLRRHFDEAFVLPSTAISSTGRTALGDTFAFLMFNDLLVSAAAECVQE